MLNAFRQSEVCTVHLGQNYFESRKVLNAFRQSEVCTFLTLRLISLAASAQRLSAIRGLYVTPTRNPPLCIQVLNAFRQSEVCTHCLLDDLPCKLPCAQRLSAIRGLYGGTGVETVTNKTCSTPFGNQRFVQTLLQVSKLLLRCSTPFGNQRFVLTAHSRSRSNGLCSTPFGNQRFVRLPVLNSQTFSNVLNAFRQSEVCTGSKKADDCIECRVLNAFRQSEVCTI